MSHYGILSSFDHTSNSWPIYKSRIHQWFIANDITSTTDENGVKRRGILLSAFSENTYKLAVDLALPIELQNVPFEDIIKILDVHFTPKRFGFTERFKFYSAQQNILESEAEFIARLRGLSKHCEFKDTEEALRDRFVLGLRPGPARDKLFQQKLGELTLADALEIAETTRCLQEVNDAQKWRTVPFFGETKVMPSQPPFFSGTTTQFPKLFGTQSQLGQGTQSATGVFGGTQQTVASVEGTQTSNPAASFGGSQPPVATFEGTQQSNSAAAFGGTQQSGATFGGTQQSVATFGGTPKSSSPASFVGTHQHSSATFAETQQSVATFGGKPKKTSAASFGETQQLGGPFGGTPKKTSAASFGGTQQSGATFGETQTQPGQASTIGGKQTDQAASLGEAKPVGQVLFGLSQPQAEQGTLFGDTKIQ